MRNDSTQIFNDNGTLGQPNSDNKISGPYDIIEHQFKTKTRSGQLVEVTRIRRRQENLSTFTKKGIQNKRRIETFVDTIDQHWNRELRDLWQDNHHNDDSLFWNEEDELLQQERLKEQQRVLFG